MKFKNSSVVIISVKSPPLGGATIYVDRLCEQLDSRLIDYSFFDIRRDRFFNVFKLILKNKITHIIVSNPIYRLTLIIYSKIFRKTSIVTYVGEIGRFRGLKNFFEKCSIWLCDIPIVLNSLSLKKGLIYNKKALMFSSFIPPPSDEGDFEENFALCVDFKNKYNKVFCTNASHYSISPRTGMEIYGIGDLISLFKNELREDALIISDPSNEYSLHLKKSLIALPANVLITNKGYKFTTLMKICDGVIRNTLTDGDSLTVKEALYFQKPIFATDCIERPIGTIIFSTGNMLDLKSKILGNDYSNLNTSAPINGAVQCFELYNNIKK